MPTTVYVAPVSSASPGLAAALGFIPGVGAFYNGQFAKGFVHVFIFAVLAHLADRADFLGFLVAAWMFYMVFDAYTTAKARLLGQPLPDHLGLNALLASFGLGTPLTSVPQAAAAHAGAPPAANSGDVNPGISGFVPVDQAGTSASGSAQPYTADPGLLQRSCGPGGMPIGAIILIALGVLLLLDNLGVLSFRWTAQFWPVVLIVLESGWLSVAWQQCREGTISYGRLWLRGFLRPQSRLSLPALRVLLLDGARGTYHHRRAISD